MFLGDFLFHLRVVLILERLGCVAQLVASQATYFLSSSPDSRRAVASYWQKYVHKVLVNCLGGLSLPRKSVVRLTDPPDMTLDVYRGRKTTTQQQQHNIGRALSFWKSNWK